MLVYAHKTLEESYIDRCGHRLTLTVKHFILDVCEKDKMLLVDCNHFYLRFGKRGEDDRLYALQNLDAAISRSNRPR